MDTLGLLLIVVVTAANLNDRKGATMLLEKINQIRDRSPPSIKDLDGSWL